MGGALGWAAATRDTAPACGCGVWRSYC
eukprot:SAG11_NODE_6656_length_1272_cov_1.258312_1_plen_27_part_10